MTEKIEEFWKWVETNSGNIFAEESTLQSASVKTLLSELRKIDPDLTARVDGQNKLLFISPCGYLDLLPLSDQIVELCPIKNQIHVESCFPRATPPETVVIEDRQFNLNDFHYTLQAGRGLVNIHISIPEFSAANEATYEPLVFSILDSILGERDVITKVGDIVFSGYEDLPDRNKDLTTLRKNFDLFVEDLRTQMEARRKLPADKRLSESFKPQRTRLANQIGLALDLSEECETKTFCEITFLGDEENGAEELKNRLEERLEGVSEYVPCRSLLGDAFSVSISFPLESFSGSELFKLVNELAETSIEHDFEVCDVQLVTV